MEGVLLAARDHHHRPNTALAPVCRVDYWREPVRIDFSLEAGPDSFLKQALDGVREKLARWKSDQLPAFGRPIGVIVNYAIDRAVYYGLQGNPIETFDAAYRLGETQLTIGHRKVTEEQAQVLFKVEAQPR